LRLLSQTPGQRRRAVLGPMRELGDHSIELHEQVGRVAQKLGLDELLVLDTEAEGAALVTGAGTLPAQQFADAEALVKYLQQTLKPGDRLLFKASHSVGLDRVVNQLRELFSAPAC
jgi:UDP-N-acetylmuramoyl-tripeptide--D-alanyl-D-alanine ligase